MVNIECGTRYDATQAPKSIFDSTDSLDSKDIKLESSRHVKLDYMDYTPQDLTPSVVITKYDIMKAEEFLSPEVPSGSDMLMEVEVSSGVGLGINSDALYEVDADVKQEMNSDSDACAEIQSRLVPGSERIMCNDEMSGEMKSEKLMSDEVASDMIKQEMTSNIIKQEEMMSDNIKLERMPSEKIKKEQMLLDEITLDTEASVQDTSNSPDCVDVHSDVSVDYDGSTDCEGNIQEEMTSGTVTACNIMITYKKQNINSEFLMFFSQKSSIQAFLKWLN